MAGLIAQLTAAARKRKQKKDIGTNKCMYSLPPFDRNGFKAEVHNEYLVEMRLWGEQQAREAAENKMITEHWTKFQVIFYYASKIYLVKQEEKAIREAVPFTWRRCILEGVAFTTWLGIIPLSFLSMELLFHFGTAFISPELADHLYTYGSANMTEWNP